LHLPLNDVEEFEKDGAIYIAKRSHMKIGMRLNFKQLWQTYYTSKITTVINIVIHNIRG